MSGKKRLQIVLTDEAWEAVAALTTEASNKFEAGKINYSDVINEMILCSKVDGRLLQLKHADLRRSLKVMASKENIDIESVIKSLMELKSRSSAKKGSKGAGPDETA